MQFPQRLILAVVLLLACLPPCWLLWQGSRDPYAPEATVRAIGLALPWLLFGGGGLAAALLLGYPPAMPALAIWWQTTRQRLGTDRGPYYELLSRLRNFDNQDDRLRAGRMARLFGDRNAAAEHLARAFELDPNHLPTRFEFGLLLHDVGQLQQAGQLLHSVIQEDPNHGSGEALERLARIALSAGQYAAATELLQAHQQQYPGSRQVHLLRARSEAGHGNMERARSELQAARRPADEHERLTPQDRLAQARARVTRLRQGEGNGG